MWVLAVTVYFVLACAISWMMLFPAGREFVLNALAGAGARLGRRAGALAQQRLRDADALRANGRAAAGTLAGFVRRHWIACTCGAALVCLPPLAALLLTERPMLSGYESLERPVNTQVADLLQGEQLVPPPPLPPLVFATAEVAQERPLLASASRDWALLNADYTQRLLTVFRIMKERHGYEMAILEGYRSAARQDALAALGPGVTNARAWQSWHQYGLAADCAFVRDGKLVISEKDPWAMRGYQLYGQVAESVGLTWGGRWKMMDLGHTELRLPGVMKH
ncbi:peptidoglycan L-alanyl-D-glutamate endopeptidase CwlK [Massilia sp. PDC64]|nr:M15 family metallopeptidase [Massilia sp. PDC64]SDF77243.1 peptidoglycan L-alanyl-D-glutamate endopeptidase CwlK [Massilia sp. PDC64]